MKRISLINRCLAFILAVSVSAFLNTSAYGEWVEQKKIRAIEDASGNFFGYSAVIDANYAIVGAYGDTEDGNEQVGSAYIFAYYGTAWTQQSKLCGSSVQEADRFGYSVSLSGDYCIVGTPGDDEKGTDSGCAYVFKRQSQSWVEQVKLTAADSSPDASFGCSVSISGEYLIVGAHKDDDNGPRSGSAYIFKHDANTGEWLEQVKLKRSHYTPFDEFGISVHTRGDKAIVGAHYGNGNTSNSGSAHIYARAAAGEQWIEQARITAADGAIGDAFGYSVGIDANYAVIGAYSDDDRGDGSGSVYVFADEGQGWLEQVKLTASDGTAADFLGYSVSISGHRVIAGAYGEDDYRSNFGCAYVFERAGTNWVEQTKLTAIDGATEDRLGHCVSLSGEIAIAGAFQSDDNGADSGSVHIFRLDNAGWERAGKLVPWGADGAVRKFLGWSVSIDGDYGAVGAWGDTDKGHDSGAVYMLKREETGWKQASKVRASDASADDAFGYSVWINGDYMIAGAYGKDDNGSGSGAAYIFSREGIKWVEQAKLVASDAAPYDFFGIAVSIVHGSISGDYAIIGANWDDDNGPQSGSAYIYKRGETGWGHQAKLLASDGWVEDNFGISVAISGEYAVVGAYGDDDYKGAAYVFKRQGTTWVEQAKLSASDGAGDDFFGYSVSLSANGAYCAVGAAHEGVGAEHAGAVYVFRRDGTNWTQEAKLTTSDGIDFDNFGIGVSISGDSSYLVAGSFYDTPNGSYSGSAYIFRHEGTQWIETTKLVPSDGHSYAIFGYSVSISGEYVLSGADGDDEAGADSGAAYIFKRGCPDADMNGDCIVDFADFTLLTNQWLHRD